MNDSYIFKAKNGLNRAIVTQISEQKNEPGWMTDFRLTALAHFESMPMPSWGPDLSALDPDDICYYLKAAPQKNDWQDLPEDIRTTFQALGIPQAEQKYLAGVGAQYESEVVYKALKKKWADQGVVFSDMNDGLTHFPELVKKYFASIIPAHDNKFAALNSAVWSGGSFVYVPAGVVIDMPLQAYFRINAPNIGQFERTLIIAEPGSVVHYVEGCSAPAYRTSSLHSAVVEVVALANSHVRYTTIQNWSSNVYNLVTKRAVAYHNARVEWVDGNFGSCITMKYPCVVLKESGARAHIISIAVAGSGQQQDAGAKVIHLAPHTASTILSKSISSKGGVASYRGLVKAAKGLANVESQVQCDALLLDSASASNTYPSIVVNSSNVQVHHEASVSTVSEEQLLYARSRGLSEQQARALIVNGFIVAFVNELPMEYAVEINRLIAATMEGSIG